MTRETKIGLLVGLAFIIVIGILLSDHLTSSTEPPQAALAGAGSNVRSAVTVPGQPGPQPPTVTPPTNPAPQNQVATQNELAPAPNPVMIIKAGPNGAGAETAPPPVTIVKDQTTQPPSDQQAAPASGPRPAPEVAGADAPPTITNVPDQNSSPIGTVARQHGEELVRVSADGSTRSARSNTASSANHAGMTEYKAQPGDSLSRIAARFMGSSTKANLTAIVAVNPSLKDDPNKVIVGRTYMIPAAPTASTAAAPTPAPSPETAIAPQRAAATEAPRADSAPAAAEYWYTVKEGDSLWRIATEQCGRSGAVAAIKELNKDTLKGDEHDIVIVGSKLRLPGKPVATASN